MDGDIQKILDGSDKAEILEKIADALDTEGHKLVLIIGLPSEDGNKLEMEITQSGFLYLFEELGFMREGHDMAEDGTRYRYDAEEKERGE